MNKDVEQELNLKHQEPSNLNIEYLRNTSEAKKCVEEFLLESQSLRSSDGVPRVIDEVLDLKHNSQLRANSTLSDFIDNFYVVTFEREQGYAIVSKDKRSFPILAVLDSGAYRDSKLKETQMLQHIQNMIAGTQKEIQDYKESFSELRGNRGNAYLNTENARQDMLNSGWRITRSAEPRLRTLWRQAIIKKDFYISKRGLSYFKAYTQENIEWTNRVRFEYNLLRSSASDTDAFGCTPIAFGQVMYALKDFPGFNTLKYSNGEQVLWDKMDSIYSLSIENQRFLGWFTANCDPTYFKEGTMIFNIKATKFLRQIVGDHITSRYDNCIVGDGDFDGYGWSEDQRVAEDFFNHQHAFVIMTASSGALNYVSYHTFVIDGMVEFQKRIQGSGFLGTGLFKKWRNGIRHLYHVNAGWGGLSNGYFLYVQNVNDEFKYTGSNDAMDYRSKPAYLILWPNKEN